MSSNAVTSAIRRAQALAHEIKAEGREATPKELATLEQAAELAERVVIDERIESFGEAVGPAPNQVSADWTDAGDPGSQFIRSEGYRRVKNAGLLGQNWSTGPVEVGMMMKGTLLEGVGAPGSGTGGGAIPVPQVIPGVVSRLFQPLTFEALLSAGQATTSTVRYAVEGTATSGAAGVPEGGVKPESTIALSTVDERVKKIASVIHTSDELIQDAPAVQSFINGELARFVNVEVERQLLRGSAGGDEVQGLLTSRGVPVYTAGTAQGNIAEQLFKAANSMRGSAFVEPDWYVVHPDDYQKLRLLKDNSGQLYFGGPNAGSYGVGQGGAASPQITGVPDLVWGKPCYVTPIIGSGTALVGTRSGAQVWSRGALTVEASTSHDQHFVKDLVAIRAERRLALTVYRNSAYVEVRGLA